MLTYHLDPHSKTPLYEQLYRAVRADIMSGTLAGGTRLPSKRQLAANLRVSQITVETAYGQLLAEGYIVSEPRRGYFVQKHSRRRPKRRRRIRMPRRRTTASTISARISWIRNVSRSQRGRGCRAAC